MINRHRTAPYSPGPFIAACAAFLCFLTVLTSSLAAATTESVDPRTLVVPALPGWLNTPLGLNPPPRFVTNDTKPTRLLIVERQVDVESRQDFAHYAYRIETEAGLQQSGQITVGFVPAYQTLRWHFLRIWRDGKARDVLDPNSIQVLRQEEDADKFLYHGQLTALVILHDLRVGDSIEYAYTLTGINPVFENRYSATFIGASSTPIDDLYYQIRAAPGRPLHIASIGALDAAYSTTNKNGGVVHTWRAKNVAAVQAINDAPSHIAQFPYIQISEYGSWSEVRDWARKLFSEHVKPDAVLEERIKAITAGCITQEQKANALLHFVQDDIRYLALHFGQSTHRPAAPLEVLDRRFGDCKDKALLLVVLLRRLGIQADVALVNSSWGRGVKSLLPSPGSFDHAIVRVTNQERDYFTARDSYSTSFDTSPVRAVYSWLDPTLTLQGGSFSQRYVPDYGFALVLSDSDIGLGLVPVQSPGASAGAIEYSESYLIPDYTSPASLDLVTTYRGSSADAFRYYRRLVEPERNTRKITGYLERYFPKIKALKQIEWTDDRAQNVLTSRLSLELPDFWKTDTDGRIRRIEFYPWALADHLPRPETMDRSVPFAIPYPIK